MRKLFTTALATLIAFYAYSQQYLPLTGGTLTGPLYIQAGSHNVFNSTSSGNDRLAHEYYSSNAGDFLLRFHVGGYWWNKLRVTSDGYFFEGSGVQSDRSRANIFAGAGTFNGSLSATTANFRIDHSAATRNISLTNNNTTNGTGTSINMGFAADSGDPYGVRLVQTGSPQDTRSGTFAIQRHGNAPGVENWLNSLYIDLNGNTSLSGKLTGTSANFNGLVGIGTTSPTAKLTVQDPGNTFPIHISGNNQSNGIAIGTDGVNKASIQGYTKDFVAYNDISLQAGGGNVGIGTTNPQGYKLSVAGKIRASEIKVEALPWPDYVFDQTYKLPDLKATEQFIKENKHLPEIPSAAEVAKDGVNLGEMNAKLLQKIEELTLYIIEQNKRSAEQDKRIANLEKHIKQ
ncbi:MAG TPA: hypothetical protein VGB63_07585 [Pedobacter sp.]|jgi:hypothetical protein